MMSTLLDETKAQNRQQDEHISGRSTPTIHSATENITPQINRLQINHLAESTSLAGDTDMDLYKITKSDSQNSIAGHCQNDEMPPLNMPKKSQQLSPNQQTSSSGNPKRITASRCANRRDDANATPLGPKNSLNLDGVTNSGGGEGECKDGGASQLELLLNDMNVRPRGTICKKRVNAQNVVSCSGMGGINVLGWQATRQTTRERMAHMLMNEQLADVFFLFAQADGILQKVPAHKFVLSIGSAVFEAMFRFNESSSSGGCANCIREIELIDVEREAFEALLTFLYTDSTQMINKDSVMSILYTAKKYAVPALETACITFLENCLNSENAFMLLSKARFYDEDGLASQCLDIIDDEAQEALKSDDFLAIDHETLCLVLRRNTLRVKELTLFNAVRRWAQEACRLKDWPPTPENQRKVLGNSLYLIRFPLMNPTDFAKHVAPSKLLNDTEMVSVFLFYHTGPEHPIPFSPMYRGLCAPEMVVNRFQRVESSWGYTGTPDRVKFMVDTSILILGFGLYGSNRDSCQYSVLIEILNFNNGKLLASNECQFISDGTPKTFLVMFEEPVEIAPNTTYIASANLTGHESHYGSKGLRKIKLERPGRQDINWHFQYAPGNNNGTSVEDGQIPEIYFCEKKHPY